MNEHEFLEKAVEQYQKEGYSVITHPNKDELPPALGELEIGLVARRGNEAVAVQFKRRDQLYDLNGLPHAVERMHLEPGWRLDLVVFPPEGGIEVPRDGSEPDAGYIQFLIEEARQALGLGVTHAAFLIAWAAAEAAMREAARGGGLAIDREVPSFVLKNLYSAGIISREDYDRVGQCLQVRNALVHGFAPPRFAAADVEFLLAFTNQLRHPEPVEADS